jgi:hypothetical protein
MAKLKVPRATRAAIKVANKRFFAAPRLAKADAERVLLREGRLGLSDKKQSVADLNRFIAAEARMTPAVQANVARARAEAAYKAFYPGRKLPG